MTTKKGVNLFTISDERKFYVEEVIPWDELATVYDDVDPETCRAILELAGDVIGNEIMPRARENDSARYSFTEEGDLIWPDGIQKCYDALKKNGLICLNISQEYDGMGLPTVLTTFFMEMLCQADAGFATIPLLQTGVAELIELFGNQELKEKYLPRMVSGEFTGSMDMTEPGAGSDLGQIVVRAKEIDHRIYITGEKLFITNGGADVHLVLARDEDVFDETKGTTKGISMYLVPKMLDSKRNHIKVTSIEEKLGVHSASTCVVQFEEIDGYGAEGFLIGEKGQGLQHMFTLMNNARLGIAIQALGISEAALIDAKKYARQRKTFGKPIKDHSLIKIKLAEMQMYTEMIRAVIYKTAFAVSMEEGLRKKIATLNDSEEKTLLEKKLKKYANQAAVLTPLIKYFAAEKAIQLTRDAVQIYAGMGYMKDCNVERYLRDSVITAIYEGTSEIQVSLFMREALKSKMVPQKARANVLLLLDEIDDRLEKIDLSEFEDSVKSVQEANEDVKESLNCLASYYKESIKRKVGKNPIKMAKAMKSPQDYADTDSIFMFAGVLAEMTVIVYGAYLLLQQADKNEKKAVVARQFIKKMSFQIKNQAKQIRSINQNTLSDFDIIIS